jgi:hypothetical protein
LAQITLHDVSKYILHLNIWVWGEDFGLVTERMWGQISFEYAKSDPNLYIFVVLGLNAAL